MKLMVYPFKESVIDFTEDPGNDQEERQDTEREHGHARALRLEARYKTAR